MSIDKSKDPHKDLLANFGARPLLRVLLSKKNKNPQATQAQSREDNRPTRKEGLMYDRGADDQLIFKPRSDINFWDLGQILSGEVYVDLDYNSKPGVTITIVNMPVNPVPQFAYEQYTLTHWNELYDKIFEVPMEDWDTTYRKITFDDGHKYGISVYQGRGGILVDGATPDPANQLRVTNPEWVSSGLKSLESWIYVQPTGGLAMPFDTSNTSLYKITGEYDYFSDEVTLDVKDGADIFLVPRPTYSTCFQECGVDEDHRRSILMGEWTIRSREMNLDKTMRRTTGASVGLDVPVFDGNFVNYPESVGDWMYDSDYINDTFATEFIDWMKARPEATLYVQRGTNASGGATYGYESLANFPFAPTVEDTINNVDITHFTHAESFLWVSGGTDGEMFDGEGVLVAVIRVGSNWKYVWKKTTGGNGFWPTIGWETPNWT